MVSCSVLLIEKLWADQARFIEDPPGRKTERDLDRVELLPGKGDKPLLPARNSGLGHGGIRVDELAEPRLREVTACSSNRRSDPASDGASGRVIFGDGRFGQWVLTSLTTRRLTTMVFTYSGCQWRPRTVGRRGSPC